MCFDEKQSTSNQKFGNNVVHDTLSFEIGAEDKSRHTYFYLGRNKIKNEQIVSPHFDSSAAIEQLRRTMCSGDFFLLIFFKIFFYFISYLSLQGFFPYSFTVFSRPRGFSNNITQGHMKNNMKRKTVGNDIAAARSLSHRARAGAF